MSLLRDLNKSDVDTLSMADLEVSPDGTFYYVFGEHTSCLYAPKSFVSKYKSLNEDSKKKSRMQEVLDTCGFISYVHRNASKLTSGQENPHMHHRSHRRHSAEQYDERGAGAVC